VSEREAGHHRDHRKEKTTMVWPGQKYARGENTKVNYGLDTAGEKEKRTSKKNVDGKSSSSHDNKKFRTRSMEKQKGMAFGFRKTVTPVKKNQTDRLLLLLLLSLLSTLCSVFTIISLKQKHVSNAYNVM